MNTLQAIAEKLDTKVFLVTLTSTELEVETWDELSFAVSDQLDSDGYIAIMGFYGTDRETNAYLYEREWAVTTVSEAVNVLNEAREDWEARYSE